MGRFINTMVGLAAALGALIGTGNPVQSASQEELSAWQMAQRLDTPEAYQMFLEVYPDSEFTGDAFSALADSFASEAGAEEASEMAGSVPETASGAALGLSNSEGGDETGPY